MALPSYVLAPFFGAGPGDSSFDFTIPVMVLTLGSPGLMLVPALDEKRRFGRQGHTRDEPGPSALQSPQRLAPPNQASRGSVSGLPSKRLRPPRETAAPIYWVHCRLVLLSRGIEHCGRPGSLPKGYATYSVEFHLTCALHPGGLSKLQHWLISAARAVKNDRNKRLERQAYGDEIIGKPSTPTCGMSRPLI
jgi:hypothetical protein